MKHFDWDPDKKAENPKIHRGVTFEDAKQVFRDKFAIERQDELHHERSILIGMAAHRLLLVVYIDFADEDHDVVRIISARRANRKERRAYENGDKNQEE